MKMFLCLSNKSIIVWIKRIYSFVLLLAIHWKYFVIPVSVCMPVQNIQNSLLYNFKECCYTWRSVSWKRSPNQTVSTIFQLKSHSIKSVKRILFWNLRALLQMKIINKFPSNVRPIIPLLSGLTHTLFYSTIFMLNICFYSIFSKIKYQFDSLETHWTNKFDPINSHVYIWSKIKVKN